jgi:acyl transferase domain-containing protein
MRPGRGEVDTFTTALAEAWVRGAPVDWTPLFPGARRVDLPTYAFRRRRFWPTPTPTPTPTLTPAGAAPRPADPDAIVAGWRYGIEWRPRTVDDDAATPSPVAGRRWLVLRTGGVDDDVSSWCDEALRQHGAEVKTLDMSAEHDRASVGARFAAEVASAGPVDGVLSLVGLDETLDPTGTVAVGLTATLAIVQALDDAGVAAPLWCVTRSAVHATDVRPLQAQVWGLGRVVGLEHPGRWGGLVDLPEQLDDHAAALLIAALAGTGAEDQLAIRPEGLLVRRLAHMPTPPPAGPDPEWRTGGTAVVTGGTGALGGLVGRWLVGRGAEHVVLVSRRGAEAPDAAAVAADIGAAGTTVTVVACDVADAAGLERVIAEVPADRPVRTIVHCAGASKGGELVDVDPVDLVQASVAKARGARVLDELAERHGLELDAFVLFSSGAAVWGGGTQGSYAAANAYVDALAEQRRARGRPATSLAWGPWAGQGMAEGETGEQLRRWGVREMPPDLALRALQRALDLDDTCVAVADLDWQRFAPSFAATRRRPLMEDVPEAARALDPTWGGGPEGGADDPDAAATGRASALEQRLAGLEGVERRAALVDIVRAEVAAVLGHTGADAVDPARTFKDLGFDSVTAVELRNRLQALTGLRLPATLVFDHPNPGALGRELAERTAPEVRSPGAEALRHLVRVEAALADPGAGGGDDEALAQVRLVLRRLMGRLDPPARDGDAAGDPATTADDRPIEDRLQAADDDELLAFIDRELG